MFKYGSPGCSAPHRGSRSDHTLGDRSDIFRRAHVRRHRVDEIPDGLCSHTPDSTAAAVAARMSTVSVVSTTPIPPSTRTSVTPGRSRAGASPDTSPGSEIGHLGSPVPGQQELGRRDRDGTRERIGHERRPVHDATRLPGADRFCDLRRAEHRGEGQVAAGQRFPHAHQVGRDAGVVGGEQLTGPAEPGRDLVEDQDQFVFVAHPPQLAQVRRVVEAHPPAPCTIGSTITRPVRRRARSGSTRRPRRNRGRTLAAAPVRTPGGPARPSTSRACRRRGRRRSSARGCRRGIRPAT